MSRKRVVVTGLSALTPLGGNVTETWDNLLAGKSGIGPITLFDASGFDSRIAGEVKGFDPEAYGVPAKQARRMDRFVQFAVAAGNMLVEHSGLVINDDNAGRVSVILGVGLGGLHTIEVFHSRLVEAGPGKVSPFMIPMLISNMAPGQLAIATGAKGANMVLTSACASGTHAIGAAYTEIVMGRCDACISGGVEATVTPMGISGFTALKALSTAHNDDPEKASRPFDKDRDGFVMGEGAGLLMLESLEHAQKWLDDFIEHYNEKHRHCGIRMVTPGGAFEVRTLRSCAAAGRRCCVLANRPRSGGLSLRRCLTVSP